MPLHAVVFYRPEVQCLYLSWVCMFLKAMSYSRHQKTVCRQKGLKFPSSSGCECQKPIIPIPQAWSRPRSFPSRILQGWVRKGSFRYTVIHLQSSNGLTYSHTYSVPCYPRHHQAFSSMVNDCFKSSKHCDSLWFQVSPFQLLSSNKNFEGKEASQSLPGLPQTFKSRVNESWCNPKMILIRERTLAKCLGNSKTMRKETLWKWTLLQASKFKLGFLRLCWPIELQLWPVTSESQIRCSHTTCFKNTAKPQTNETCIALFLELVLFLSSLPCKQRQL